jgi:hypothetical protein
MKCILTLPIVLVACNLFAQDGYIKFNKHTVVHGFVNKKVSGDKNEEIIEFLKIKHDPAPQHYRKADVYEYAIKHDTFRVLKNFYPFEVEGFYFEHVDARVLHSGDVDLLGIDVNHEKFVEHNKKGSFHHMMDQTLGSMPYLYVLHEESDEYFRAVPSKKNKFKELMF